MATKREVPYTAEPHEHSAKCKTCHHHRCESCGYFFFCMSECGALPMRIVPLKRRYCLRCRETSYDICQGCSNVYNYDIFTACPMCDMEKQRKNFKHFTVMIGGKECKCNRCER